MDLMRRVNKQDNQSMPGYFPAFLVSIISKSAVRDKFDLHEYHYIVYVNSKICAGISAVLIAPFTVIELFENLKLVVYENIL